MVPVVFVVGEAKAGKTSLITALLAELKAQGYRVGVIKHSSHSFSFEPEGKDTARFAEAGAEMVIFASPEKSIFIYPQEQEKSWEELLSQVQGVDLVLGEGYRWEKGPKILVYRTETREPLSLPELDPKEFLAIVSDKILSSPIPCFLFSEVPNLAGYLIAEYLETATSSDLTSPEAKGTRFTPVTEDFFKPTPPDLTHLDAQGKARMVDITAKEETVREAVAHAELEMHPDTLALISRGSIPKGDVFGTARVAGMLAAKKTPELVPLCHPLLITGIEIDFYSGEGPGCLVLEARVKAAGKTGVEMEALTAVMVAALTVYDMCKALDREMAIGSIYLVAKSGGKSRNFRRKEKDGGNFSRLHQQKKGDQKNKY